MQNQRGIRPTVRPEVTPGLMQGLTPWIKPRVQSPEARIQKLALLWHFRLGDICKEPVTVRTSSGWRSCEEVEDRLPDGRHAWLWWRSRDSFFSVPLL